jgi:phosphoribosylformylglycinamidine synthase
MKFGVIVYPGSNCDGDAYYALTNIVKAKTRYLWYEETDISDIDVIILPGGFSYGDYLRCGAIARFAPVSNSIIEHVNKGKIVIGICNGFQILTELQLLPGALIRNINLKFICKDVHLKVLNKKTSFTKQITNDVIKIPIAHGEGNYRIEEDGLKELYDNEQIIFQYSSENGDITSQHNENGSLDNIAGICNKNKNVLGLMPHPERACESILGSTDGLLIFKSLLS